MAGGSGFDSDPRLGVGLRAAEYAFPTPLVLESKIRSFSPHVE